ncbi:PAS domain-containing protein [Rhizobium cremeum]|uniref:PAS domain-containing protein n=1 Tax=Rhizobium cremeum TaxID=2813827 RepID=UPI000DE388F7|nr:PAS domain-containing protein [Rhizobium cremeum]MCJ7996516.1 PAS domain-containing protein [Rhizobium cremeum]MCJ8001775.1 PAS domain-containing protein [Rhizobium cremeum]
MFNVAVLEGQALDLFRHEHPWLGFPKAIRNVTLFLDDNGGPTRLTAEATDQDGNAYAFDVDSLGVDTLLSLIRFAPRGVEKVVETPEEAQVWRILENLPLADEGEPDDVTLEAERMRMLEEAYGIVREMAARAFREKGATASSPQDGTRLDKAERELPKCLTELTEAHKPLFLEVDLWRLAAILRDEVSMPIDIELSNDRLSAPGALEDFAPDTVIGEAGRDSLIQALFDLSPVAFSISTTGQNCSRYVRVNKAYLDLVGKSWEEIKGHEMVSSGLVVDNEARGARLARLDKEGGYAGERAEIRNAAGEIIPVIITAKRLSIAGQSYDFEVLTKALP